MNLHYMVHKNDRRLATTAGVRVAARKIDGESWRGIEIDPGPEPQVRVKGATRFFPFRERSETIGWKAVATARESVLRVQFETPEPLPAWKTQLNGAPANVVIPWPIASGPHGTWDLALHVPASARAPVFLGVHKMLDRAPLLALCKGVGLELGPGPKPQVLPGPDVSVRYVEQKSPQEWAALYGAHYDTPVDESLWGHYIVGEAHDLPVDDASLDFIFSSHVFEHLANPLGHLEVWARKLKPGGRIVAVIPDLAGSKDQAAAPTTVEEAIAEYEAQAFTPTLAHYQRFAAARDNLPNAQAQFDAGRSIHVHFYSNANIAAILDVATRRFGLAGYAVRHTPNHKDFHIVVTR